MTLHCFGDSITAGSSASVLAKDYVNLLAAGLGLSASNHGTSTQMVMDGYDVALSATVNTGDLCTVMWGTNDEAVYTDATKRGYYVDGLRSILVRLSSGWSPATPAGGVTFTGTWGTGYAWGMYGSGVPGSKASFVASGSRVVIGTLRQLNNTATFRVRVAGVDKGVFSTGGNVTTLLGVSFGPYGLAFATNPGDVVELSVVTADASNVVYFHWYSNCTPKARVVAINTPNFVGTLSGQVSGGTLANVAALNSLLASLVTEVAGYGLDVQCADINSLLTSDDMSATEKVHPLDSGHAKIAGAVYKKFTGNDLLAPVATYITSDGGSFYIGEGAQRRKLTVT